MSKITYEGQVIDRPKDKSVLDTLQEAGHKIPSSCKAGVCQACVMIAKSGDPGEESKEGLTPNEIEMKKFKACCSKPEGDLEVVLEDIKKAYSCSVTEQEMLNERTLFLRMTVPKGFEYKAGQFINVIRKKDGLMRSYSIASTPDERFIELHVRVYEDGKMSSWLQSWIEPGDELHFTGPFGECFYTDEKPEAEMLLAGIGTGMAPLYGIAREALRAGHKGRVTIIQGAMDEAGLYYTEEFAKIAEEFSNCEYISSTVDGSGEGNEEGKIDDVVKVHFPSTKGMKVFLCGSPNTVNRLKKYSFLAGASMSDIHSDPFTQAES
ncbi:MAG: FAD-binding oxidoreductase [Lentisphaerales bacterium]|nr:FAD-binding oxidoreductase [Lentisphaerales bacterium]